MKNYFVIIIFLLIFISKAISQDVGFSQFFSNKLYLNPGFAGTDIDVRYVMNYRNQWPELKNAYISYSFSFDKYIKKINGGVGINIIQDRQGKGTFNTTFVDLVYAYQFRLSQDLYLSAGLQFSFIDKTIDTSGKIFPSMLDDFHQSGTVNYAAGGGVATKISRNYFDFSSGVVAAFRNYYFGLSVHHILNHSDVQTISLAENIDLPRKYTLYSGVNLQIYRSGLVKEDFSISPNILMQYQHGFTNMNYGLYVNYNNALLGLWARNNVYGRYDSAILSLGYRNNIWQISYSYDKSISGLFSASAAAHEVSLVVRLRYKPKCSVDFGKKIRLQAMKCPDL